MNTLTIPRQDLGQIRAGDRIVAIDGRVLRRAATVARALGPVHPRPGAAQGIGLVNTLGTGTAWNLYPESQVEVSVTVERETDAPTAPEPVTVEPPAPKARRTATRTVNGLRLIADAAHGGWRTEDGRWEVFYNDDFVTYCENPHPVRIGAERAARIREDLRVPGRAEHIYGAAAAAAVRKGRWSYLCPGGEEHNYGRWSVWDARGPGVEGDYASPTGPGVFATFTEAAEWLAAYLRRGGA